MTKTEPLLQESTLRIVKTVFAGFKALCQNISVQTCEQSMYNSPTLTTITIRSDTNIEIATNQPINGEDKFFQVQPDHIYKLIWYNRLFLVAFHSSPEVYGYYSTLEVSKHYTFCSIIEMHNKFHKRYEMNFSFNSKTRRFLELFDVEFYIRDDFVKECIATDSIEHQLRDRILY